MARRPHCSEARDDDRALRQDAAEEACGTEAVARPVAASTTHAQLYRDVRDSEERLRLALAAGRMGSWEWHLHSARVTWSRELESIHGYPPGGFGGTVEAYEREIHPDDRERVQVSVRSAIEHDTPHEVRYRIVRLDGEVRWVEGRGKLERDADGLPERLIGVCCDVTDRIEAERALHESERRFRAIFDHALDAILLADDGGRILDVNVAATELFDRDRATLLASTSMDLVSARPGPVSEDLWSSFRLEGAQRGELVIARRDRTTRTVEYVATADVLPGCHLSVLRDVTERTRTENALRILAAAGAKLASSLDFETTLRSVAELTVPAIADWASIDLAEDDGSVRQVAFTHIDPANIAHALELRARRPLRTDDDFGPPRVIRTGEPEVRYEITDTLVAERVPDSLMRESIRAIAPRSSMIVPLRGRDRVIGALSLAFAQSDRRYGPSDLVIAEDLAQRITVALENASLFARVEAARVAADATAERARFLADASRALAESLDATATLTKVARLAVPRTADLAGVYEVAMDGAIHQVAVAHADPALEDLVREFHRLLPPHVDQDRPLPIAIRTATAQILEDVPETLRGIRGATTRAVEIVERLGVRSYIVVPITVRGRCLGAIALASTSSRRRFGPADLALFEELARRVGATLENARLYAEVQEASRLKDDFLATISHELRTPMNAILGWATLLPTRADDRNATARGLAAIERNARAQARLIEDVLDVSRIVTGKLRLTTSAFELDGVVSAAIDMLSSASHVKGITVRTEIEPSTGAIVGDPMRLQQIVSNLVSNAVKFTAPGGSVHVRARRVALHVEIEVTDDGAGIAPAFLPFVFDRFRQGDSSITRHHGGLGLGLAISKHLVELHGGTIAVYSAGEGLGATFTVRLPIPGAHTIAESARELPPGARTEEGKLAGVRVIACDDEPDALELVKEVLSASGAEVITCSSAAEALAILDRVRVDVLVSDIAMPGEDGYSLIARVRALSPASGGRVVAVALTALARGEDRRRALAAGFQQHVSKPIDPRDLIVVISSLVGRFGPRASD